MPEQTLITGSLPEVGTFHWGTTVNDFIYKLVIDHNLLAELLATGRLSALSIQTLIDAAIEEIPGATAPEWGALVGDIADQGDLMAILNDKLDAADIAGKADTTTVNAALALKADASALTAGLATKADAAATTSALALKAPLASPGFTGVPTVPTPAPGTNNTQAASTAFVTAALSALVSGAPGLLDTLDELAAALGDDPNFATTITTALAGKAPLASPGLTGTPTVPTAAPGTNNTQAASTAFVAVAIAALISAATNLPTADTLAKRDSNGNLRVGGAVHSNDAVNLQTLLDWIATTVQKNMFDAKGDLIVGTGNDTVTKVSAGTDGHVLTLDSSQTAGMKWAPGGGGGGGIPTLPAATAAADVDATTATSVKFVDLPTGQSSWGAYLGLSAYNAYTGGTAVLETAGILVSGTLYSTQVLFAGATSSAGMIKAWRRKVGAGAWTAWQAGFPVASPVNNFDAVTKSYADNLLTFAGVGSWTNTTALDNETGDSRIGAIANGIANVGTYTGLSQFNGLQIGIPLVQHIAGTTATNNIQSQRISFADTAGRPRVVERKRTKAFGALTSADWSAWYELGEFRNYATVAEFLAERQTASGKVSSTNWGSDLGISALNNVSGEALVYTVRSVNPSSIVNVAQHITVMGGANDNFYQYRYWRKIGAVGAGDVVNPNWQPADRGPTPIDQFQFATKGYVDGGALAQRTWTALEALDPSNSEAGYVIDSGYDLGVATGLSKYNGWYGGRMYYEYHCFYAGGDRLVQSIRVYVANLDGSVDILKRWRAQNASFVWGAWSAWTTHATGV